MNRTALPAVNLDPYTRAHGRRTPARGTASWAFSPRPDARGSDDDCLILHVRTYAQAKKDAQKHFQGHTRIHLLA